MVLESGTRLPKESKGQTRLVKTEKKTALLARDDFSYLRDRLPCPNDRTIGGARACFW